MLINPRLKRKSSKKGQMFGSDFIVSAVLFIAILAASIELWNLASAKYSGGDSNDLMMKKAISITDTLIKTEGVPKNWTDEPEENIKLIGVSENVPQVLDSAKLAKLKTIGCDNLKSVWGISDYNVHIVFENSAGNTIQLNSGENLTYCPEQSNQKDLVPFKRLVLINDSGTLIRGAMTLIIWR